MAERRSIAGRRWLLGGIGLVLSAAGLWYVLGGVDPAEVLASASRVEIWPLLAGTVIFWVGLVSVRAFLVRHLLRTVGEVPLGRAYRFICIGYLANNVLPLRAGELARLGGIARASGLSYAAVAGSMAVERALDMMMITVIGVAAAQVAPLPEAVRLVVLITGGGMVFAFLVFVFVARRRLQEVDTSVGRRWLRSAWNLIVRFSAGFGALQTHRGALVALLCGALIWGLIVVVLLLRLMAFGLPPSLPVTLVLLTALSFGVALPSAPAYVGVYHAAATFALANVMGISVEIAAGFAFFSWLVDVLSNSVVGGVSMVLEGMSWADLKRGQRSADPQAGTVPHI